MPINLLKKHIDFDGFSATAALRKGWGEGFTLHEGIEKRNHDPKSA